MNKAKVAALVVMTAVLAFGAPQQAKDWVQYNSEEGRYSVLLPTQPVLNSQDATTSTGQKATQHYASSTDESTAYLVGYFDKAGATFSFDRARDGMVAKIRGTLLAEKVISLSGYAGREVKVAAKGSDGGDYIAVARYYEVKERIYVVEVVFPKENESAAAGKSAKFFDSFAVAKPQ